uniref:Uncharacterized protein n=1 Tax=Cannabis sativa TaxID=3483 RepID=A0A803QDF6_CANSA
MLESSALAQRYKYPSNSKPNCDSRPNRERVKGHGVIIVSVTDILALLVGKYMENQPNGLLGDLVVPKAYQAHDLKQPRNSTTVASSPFDETT